MPRDFDSGLPSQRWLFTERVDCPACDTMFEGQFHDDSDTVQDIAEAPQGCHACPVCGYQWVSTLTGWTFFSEAG